MQHTYPVVIETGEAGGFGAFFPDLPGCAAAGETVEDCFVDAQQALALHLKGMAEDGETFPRPTLLQEVEADADIQVAAILLATASVAGRTARINITIDTTLLSAIDAVTTNRSAFLADAALEALRRRRAS
ncbi:type II toxin-antitoxin system HicB family antitoxin [Caenispirillum bisanense]|uniref:type II toxin-antitoxin system HicB family antitoxin n=1 Tax=Caenispirillum bisanense TaxID=414052 RepID=UPI0031DB7010